MNRLQTLIVNCTRQYLAHEFPEAAKIKSLRRTDKTDVPALWGWLSGDRPSPYYDRLWSKSVAQDFGLNISEFTRSQAGRICELERYQQLIECEIKDLIAHENFVVYNSVFDSFGFGLRTRALFLTHIYPFTDFLSQINQPVIEYGESATGRPTNRDRSLRAFKLRLGMGLIEDSSGQSTSWVPGGSGLCRQAWWQWCLCRIEPKGKKRLHTEIGISLGDYLDKLEEDHLPGKIAQMRCCAKATVLLYRGLVGAISNQKDLE